MIGVPNTNDKPSLLMSVQRLSEYRGLYVLEL
jgi:hypothetical protein